MTTVTQWFDGATRPERKGAYQVTVSHLPVTWRDLYSYWDGARFCWIGDDPKIAFLHRKEKTCALVVEWRGLAEKPQEKMEGSKS